MKLEKNRLSSFEEGPDVGEVQAVVPWTTYPECVPSVKGKYLVKLAQVEGAKVVRWKGARWANHDDMVLGFCPVPVKNLAPSAEQWLETTAPEPSRESAGYKLPRPLVEGDLVFLASEVPNGDYYTVDRVRGAIDCIWLSDGDRDIQVPVSDIRLASDWGVGAPVWRNEDGEQQRGEIDALRLTENGELILVKWDNGDEAAFMYPSEREEALLAAPFRFRTRDGYADVGDRVYAGGEAYAVECLEPSGSGDLIYVKLVHADGSRRVLATGWDKKLHAVTVTPPPGIPTTRAYSVPFYKETGQTMEPQEEDTSFECSGQTWNVGDYWISETDRIPGALGQITKVAGPFVDLGDGSMYGETLNLVSGATYTTMIHPGISKLRKLVPGGTLEVGDLATMPWCGAEVVAKVSAIRGDDVYYYRANCFDEQVTKRDSGLLTKLTPVQDPEPFTEREHAPDVNTVDVDLRPSLSELKTPYCTFRVGVGRVTRMIAPTVPLRVDDIRDDDEYTTVYMSGENTKVELKVWKDPEIAIPDLGYRNQEETLAAKYGPGARVLVQHNNPELLRKNDLVLTSQRPGVVSIGLVVQTGEYPTLRDVSSGIIIPINLDMVHSFLAIW